MRGVYTVSGTNQTVLNALVTLIFVNPATTVSARFLRFWVSQRANATSAQQGIQISTQVTAFPTVVSATPAKTTNIDQASAIVGGVGGAGTAGINASAEGAGAKTIIVPDNFNVLNGWLYVPTPAEASDAPAANAAGTGLVFSAGQGTQSGWAFGLTYQEN